YAKIPNDSVYKPSARTRHDKFVAAYVAKVRRQGQALAEKRACRELEALRAKAGKLFPAAGAPVKEIECTAPTPENPNQLRDQGDCQGQALHRSPQRRATAGGASDLPA